MLNMFSVIVSLSEHIYINNFIICIWNWNSYQTKKYIINSYLTDSIHVCINFFCKRYDKSLNKCYIIYCFFWFKHILLNKKHIVNTNLQTFQAVDKNERWWSYKVLLQQLFLLHVRYISKSGKGCVLLGHG